MPAPKSDVLWRVLHKRPLFTLAGMLVAGAGLVLWHMSRLSQHLIETSALQGTALYSQAIEELRTIYTSEVVERVRPHNIEVTHDYSSKDAAIPLPATFSMELGKRIGARGTGMEVLLFSDYPFPWRKDRKPLDDFQKRALAHFRGQPAGSDGTDEVFHEFAQYQGRPSLRYATADRMRQSCVNCHNSHADSPKSDWKVGDVRGVLEVIRPLDQVVTQTNAGLRGTSLLLAVLGMAVLGVLGVVLGRLRHTTSDLELRVDELRDSEKRIRFINEDLTIARDEALAANQAKGRFLATMSHELRTPLNAIIGYAEMLQEEAVDFNQKHMLPDLAKIKAAGNNLLLLVGDVLDYSQLDAGGCAPVSKPFEVDELVRSLVENIRPLAENRGNTLDFQCPEAIGTMCSDKNKLRSALFNVLSNACKFTDRGTIVFLTARETEDGRDWFRFTVRDTGIGIPPQQMERVFQPFVQGDDTFTRKFGGAGMGLAIARGFCRAIGGNVVVQSEVGKGSTFTIRVPAELQRSDLTKTAAIGDDYGKDSDR